MAKLNVDQINENRRVMADSTVESPYNVLMDDTADDIPERLFDSMPRDKVGLMPSNERNRSK